MRPVLGRQAAQRGEGAQAHRDVGLVLVGEVMQVDDLGLGRLEDRQQIVDHRLALRVLHGGAGVAQLDHAGVAADIGRGALLLAADALHLLVGVLAVDARARAARAVGHDDAAEPVVRQAEALGDAMVGHDLDVVLVGADAQVGGASERGDWRCAVRDEHVCVGIVKLHLYLLHFLA